MLTPDQIRAARALKNWSQSELARRVGMATPSIGNIEAGKHSPSLSTQEAIREAFDDEGVEFIDGGVRLQRDIVTMLEGDHCYLRLLDDVFHTLKGKKDAEILITCSDDRVSPADVNHSYRRMRDAGIKMRQLVEDGNEYLMGPVEEYRYLPDHRYVNRVMLIYGAKVALVLDKETKVVIFKDEVMAYLQKNLFEILWQTLPQPTRSIADERF